MTQKHKLKIEPALLPAQRQMIERLLEVMGYKVIGGGTTTDLSQCDVSFETNEEEAGVSDE